MREELRQGLVEVMSAWSEDRYAAGWMSGLEQELHERGGVWEILGKEIGWPTGYYADPKTEWVTWDEAGAIFAEKKKKWLP